MSVLKMTWFPTTAPSVPLPFFPPYSTAFVQDPPALSANLDNYDLIHLVCVYMCIDTTVWNHPEMSHFPGNFYLYPLNKVQKPLTNLIRPSRRSQVFRVYFSVETPSKCVAQRITCLTVRRCCHLYHLVRCRIQESDDTTRWDVVICLWQEGEKEQEGSIWGEGV